MRNIWRWLSDPKNQKTLTWMGSGIVVLTVGVWTVYMSFSKEPAALAPPQTTIVPSNGISAGGNITAAAAPSGTAIITTGPVIVNPPLTPEFIQELRRAFGPKDEAKKDKVINQLLRTIDEKKVAIEDRESQLSSLAQKYRELEAWLEKREKTDILAAKAKERLDERSFDQLLDRVSSLKGIAPFGINFVVNSKTMGDLDAAVQLAENLGASEFLLLPENPVMEGGGIDKDTTHTLRKWVSKYCGSVALSVSESNADGLPTCNPLIKETGLAAFAHIDASGILKRTSYNTSGIKIDGNSVMAALDNLKSIHYEALQ